MDLIEQSNTPNTQMDQVEAIYVLAYMHLNSDYDVNVDEFRDANKEWKACKKSGLLCLLRNGKCRHLVGK